MNSDKTEIAIDAITEDMDPETRREVARIIRRNSLVSKVIIRGTIVILTSFLAALGAEFAGLINLLE